MTAEGYAETEEEIKAVMVTREFMEARQELYMATERGTGTGRRNKPLFKKLLAQIRERYGPRIADGLDEWYREE